MQVTQADCPINIRSGEKVTIYPGSPNPKVSVYAAMVATIPPLPEPWAADTPTGPTESASVVGAEWNGTDWQWCYFGRSLKEIIGRALFDNDQFEANTWYAIWLAPAEEDACQN